MNTTKTKTKTKTRELHCYTVNKKAPFLSSLLPLVLHHINWTLTIPETRRTHFRFSFENFQISFGNRLLRKMNALASECSSGCESGWTLYLEHSFMNQNASHRERGTRYMGGTEGFYEEEHKEKRAMGEESDEEDLSMVSDASSWPPHFPDDGAYFNGQENGNGCFCSASKAVKLAKSSATKRQKVKEIQHREDQHLPSYLHDTASSHVFDFSTVSLRY